MARPRLRKLPESYRREFLNLALEILDRHPSLAHFRTLVRTGPERQLALLAALERSVQVGSPAANPPSPNDQSDQLLCDVLDVIDRHPELTEHGAGYGPDRHLANLQALGIWRGTEPITHPSPRELFATTFSQLTPCPVSDLPSWEVNCSPASQNFASGGEQFASKITSGLPGADLSSSPQILDGLAVVATASDQPVASQVSEPAGLIRHDCQTPGEQIPDRPTDSSGSGVVCAEGALFKQTLPQSTPDPFALPAQAPFRGDEPAFPSRVIRRGRPPALDDLAKGRLLGLMSYGLSFRQAAAQLGVHHQTLLNAMKRDEEFAQQVSEARLDAISQPLLTVVQASRTSWRAAAWLARFLEDRRVRMYETTPEEQELARLRT